MIDYLLFLRKNETQMLPCHFLANIIKHDNQNSDRINAERAESMGWLERMNQAVDYIEAHMDQEIDHDELSRIVCCSSYNFLRMFTYVTGITPSEYIRRRRLTMAAYELQTSNARIIDIALKYGYNSHESFSRSFARMHGINPSDARAKGAPLKAFPKISFQLTITGDTEIPYKIVERSKFRIFGKSVELVAAKESFYRDIQEFITASARNGLIQKIKADARAQAADDKGSVIMGFALYALNSGKKLRFMLCADVQDAGSVQGYEVLDIPGATWAVLRSGYPRGSEVEAIQKIWKRLPEWFQTTGYEYVPGSIEFAKCIEDGNECFAEVWVQIQNNLHSPEA